MNWIKASALVAIAVLGLSGCASATAPSVAAPTPVIVYATPAPTQAPPSREPSAARTQTPTAAPTAKPTPQPTPKPTAVPTKAPVSNGWNAFATHTLTAMSGLVDDWTQFETDADAGASDAVLVIDANKIIKDAHAEITWLKANPPSACYEQVYTDYYNGIASWNNAMVALKAYDFDTYHAEMTEGNNDIESATNGLDAAFAACS